jgi:hypothetical protein
MEAVDEPDAIWDKFNPTIAVEGTSYNPAPEPVIIPETDNEPVILDEVFTWKPKSGDIDAVVDPDAI